MAVNIFLTIEDIGIWILIYDQIRLYRSATRDGSYGVVQTINLVGGQFHYQTTDSAGSVNSWYKYTLYKAAGPTESDFSNVFRPSGTSRRRIRQRALADYRAGIVVAAVEGCTTEKWKTDDYRVASELFRAGRHKGGWIVPTVTSQSGLLGATRHILSNATPSSGELPVEAWPNAPVAGDEGEVHWLCSPDEWNDAINKGLARYWYLDTIPLTGVTDRNEYSLFNFPWLRKRNLHGVWHYPDGSSIQQPYAGNGKWVRVRDDADVLTMDIYPAVEDDHMLYLECTRPVAPLYTDMDSPPVVCNEGLAAALAYDEVLRMLSSPATGSSQDRRSWETARRRHAPALNKLLREFRPRPRPFPPMSQMSLPVVPDPFSPR